MTLAQCIGARLRQHREEQGLSQGAVARRAGWSQAQVSALEIGDYAPKFKTVARASQALGVHPIADVIAPAYAAWERDQSEQGAA